MASPSSKGRALGCNPRGHARLHRLLAQNLTDFWLSPAHNRCSILVKVNYLTQKQNRQA